MAKPTNLEAKQKIVARKFQDGSGMTPRRANSLTAAGGFGDRIRFALRDVQWANAGNNRQTQRNVAEEITSCAIASDEEWAKQKWLRGEVLSRLGNRVPARRMAVLVAWDPPLSFCKKLDIKNSVSPANMH